MYLDMKNLSFSNRRRAWSRIAGAVFLVFSISSQAAGEVVVVASAGSAAAPLSKEQVVEIFMGRSSSLNGTGVAPLDQAEPNLREEFYSKVTGRSAAQVKGYWAKMSFTGKGTPPREVASSAEVKKMVASDSRFIGYIEKSAIDKSVKVLFIAE